MTAPVSRVACLGGPLDGCIISHRGDEHLRTTGPDGVTRAYVLGAGKDGRAIYVWQARA